MRETGTEIGFMHGSSGQFARALRRSMYLAAAALLTTSLVTVTDARADDEEDRPQTLSERLSNLDDKIMGSIVRGLGVTNMDTAGIEYRERSPLVIPPRLDLPPPEDRNAQNLAPNWPKDADAERQRRARAEAREQGPLIFNQDARTLTPAEMAPKRNQRRSGTQVTEHNPNPMMTPGQLGSNGNLLNLFKGSNKTESTTFTSEPERTSLTQPPPGYQTPSSAHAYGTGPQEIVPQGANIMTGKY